jgi:opacity protein-like surface antigen
MMINVKNWMMGVAAAALVSSAGLSAGFEESMKIYVGGFGGYGMGDTNGKINDASFDNVAVSGGHFGGMAGVCFAMNQHLHVGVEGFGFGGKAQGTVSGEFSVGYTFHVNDGFGLAACMGVKMESAMPFVRLGWTNNKWHVSNGTTDDENDSKRLNGFVVGFGGEYCLGNGFVLGGGWDYALFKKWSTTVGGTSIEAKPRHSMFRVNVKYAF